jgi:hypothetical protein
VNIFDLLLIQQHILQLNLLPTEYKKIAADADADGWVSTIDLVIIQAWMLGSLPNGLSEVGNTTWRFVPQAYVLPTTNPQNSANLLGFPENIEYFNVTEDQLDGDFFGIKVGDVSGDVNLDLCGTPLKGANNSDDRDLDKLYFQVKDQQVAKGDDVTIEFTAKDFRNINGYQFTLDFDQDVLDFVSVNTGDLKNMSEDMFGLTFTDEGKIVGVWYDAVAQDMDDDAVLFSLTFKATSDAHTLSGLIDLSSAKLTSQAVDGNGEMMNLELEFVGEEAEQFVLLQNTPNPFKTQTTIGFILPTATNATLTIMDVSGRVLKVVQSDFAKGYNEVTLNRSEIPASGVLYYQLETPDNTETKHMIMVE